MCLENQRAHLQSVRFWDCWQRARILGCLVFFNCGKWQLSWPIWLWVCCYQVDLQHSKRNWYINQHNLKIFFTVRKVEVIWSSQLNYVLRDIIKQPWKLLCENLHCFSDSSMQATNTEWTGEERSFNSLKCSVRLVGSWMFACSCKSTTLDKVFCTRTEQVSLLPPLPPPFTSY